MIDYEIITLLTTVPTAIFSLPLLLLFFYWIICIFFGGDQNFGFDLDAEGGFFITLGLGNVPLAVGLTIFSFFATSVSMIIQHYGIGMFFNIYDEGFNHYSLFYILISIVMAIPSFIIALIITAKITAKMTPIFGQKDGELKFDYIDKIAKVRSLTLDKTFGEIILNDGISEHIKYGHLNTEEVLKRDDEVLIVEYNKSSQSFLVQKI
jgi:hypothetical protein